MEQYGVFVWGTSGTSVWLEHRVTVCRAKDEAKKADKIVNEGSYIIHFLIVGKLGTNEIGE